jgi:hypothetical protein
MERIDDSAGICFCLLFLVRQPERGEDADRPIESGFLEMKEGVEE